MLEDEAIVNELLLGNTKAVNQLVNKYSNAVYGVAYSKLRDYYIAQDVAQEVFLKAYLKIDTLKEHMKLGAWLYSLTNNACIDWLRKYTPTEGLENVQEVRTNKELEELIIEKEQRQQLKEALNSLTEESRQAIILHYISGYKIKEVAEFMDVSANTAASWIRRGRETLKGELSSRLEENLKSNKLGEDFEKNVLEFCQNIHEYLWLTDRKDDAIKILRRQLRLHPDNAELKMILADKLLYIWYMTRKAKMEVEAEKLFKEAAQADSLYDFYLSRYYLVVGKYDKAVKLLGAIDKNTHKRYSPEDVKLLYSDALKGVGRFEEAEIIIQKGFYSSYYTLLSFLQALIDVQQKSQNREKLEQYSQVFIQLIEALGAEPLRTYFAFWGYKNYGKSLLADGLAEEALPYFIKGKNRLYEILKNEPPKLFDKTPLFNGMEKEGQMEKRQIQFLLMTKVEVIKELLDLFHSEDFSVLSQDPDYIEFVNETEKEFQEASLMLKKINKEVAASYPNL